MGRGIPPGRLYIKKEERINNIRFALNAARYHWETAIAQAREGKEGNPKPIFHIRSMFWEMYSVFDYLLQLANEVLKLDFNPEKVKWESDNSKSKPFRGKLQKINKTFYSEIKKITNNYHFRLIKDLRNHSHKWVLGARGYNYIQLHPEDPVTGKVTLEELIQLNAFLDKNIRSLPATNEGWVDELENLIAQALKVLGIDLKT